MKSKLSVFLILFFMLLLCSGCMKQLGGEEGETIPSKDSASEKTVLSVYLEENIQEVLYGVEEQLQITQNQFSNLKVEKYTVASQEGLLTDILAGAGPDVYLMRERQLIHNLMQKDAFLNLSHNAEQYGYLENLLKCGEKAQESFLIPFRFRPLAFCITEDLALQCDVPLDGPLTYELFFDQFSKATGGDRKLFANYFSFSKLIQGAFPLFDEASGAVLVDNEAFRSAAEFYKKIYPEIAPLQEIGMEQSFKSFKDGDAAIYFPVAEESFMLYADQLFRNDGGSGVQLLSIPMPDADGLIVSPGAVGAISASTSLSEEAWNYLTGLTEIARENVATEKGIENSINYYQRKIDSGSPVTSALFSSYPCTIKEIRPQLKTQYFDWYRNGTSVLFTEDTVDEFINRNMQDYFDGKKNLDQCIKELENQLKLYYTE